MALNFPETDLHISPLTEKDLADLDFIVRHADLVGYSFVQRPEDVSVLLGELDARRARFSGRRNSALLQRSRPRELCAICRKSSCVQPAEGHLV
jgi:hypothetical protein